MQSVLMPLDAFYYGGQILQANLCTMAHSTCKFLKSRTTRQFWQPRHRSKVDHPLPIPGDSKACFYIFSIKCLRVPASLLRNARRGSDETSLRSVGRTSSQSSHFAESPNLNFSGLSFACPKCFLTTSSIARLKPLMATAMRMVASQKVN